MSNTYECEAREFKVYPAVIDQFSVREILDRLIEQGKLEPYPTHGDSLGQVHFCLPGYQHIAKV